MASKKPPAPKQHVSSSGSQEAPEQVAAVEAPPSVPTAPSGPPPLPEQIALERQSKARQRLSEHVATAHRHIASEIGAARQRLAEVQAKAWKLGLERRRLVERIAEIDLDLREAEKAEKIEEGAIEAYMRAQARVQPPPEVA